MDSLRHVWWSCCLPEAAEERRGLVAVRVEYDWIEVRSLAGKALPASMLLPVLDEALPEGWLDEAEELHRSRANPWTLQRYEGLSGCFNYSLYSLRDFDLLDQPRAASLHVSMCGKLNEGLRCWLGDLPPLLVAMVEDYQPLPSAEVAVSSYTPEIRGAYREAGESSGLQEALVAIRAMEVMAE